MMRAVHHLLLLAVAGAERSRVLIDYDWKFQLGDHGPGVQCNASSFPIDLNNKQCLGLTKAAQYGDEEGCRDGCCGDDACETFQWCPGGACGAKACWLGKMNDCNHASSGWISGGRQAAPTPSPAPGPAGCTVPYCKEEYDDSKWRNIDHPHDYVVRFHPPIFPIPMYCSLWCPLKGGRKLQCYRLGQIPRIPSLRCRLVQTYLRNSLRILA